MTNYHEYRNDPPPPPWDYINKDFDNFLTAQKYDARAIVSKYWKFLWDQQNQIKELKEQLNKARIVIGFYADEENYWYDLNCVQNEIPGIKIDTDQGNKARQFLKAEMEIFKIDS